jgi:hypothetical protein
MGEIIDAAGTEAEGLRFRAAGHAGNAAGLGGKSEPFSVSHNFVSRWRTR